MANRLSREAVQSKEVEDRAHSVSELTDGGADTGILLHHIHQRFVAPFAGISHLALA